MTLPINAIAPPQWQRAEDAFRRAEKLAAKYDVKVTKRVQPARQAGHSIVEYARENNADLIMMSDVPKSNRRGTRYARSVEFVFEHAPCEVIIDRPPLDIPDVAAADAVSP